MITIEVVNIKCGGCANSITNALEKVGCRNITVDETSGKVSFEGDKNQAIDVLNRMGYPQVGSPQAKNLLKKAKSYASCMVGRVQKKK